MGIVIRQSIKGSIVSYIGAAVGMVSTIFIYPYFLTPELIGLNRILVESAFLFAFVAQIGIPNAIIRFTPQLKKMGLSREAYKYALLIPLISFVFFGTVIFLGKDGIEGLFNKNSPLYSRFFLVVIPFGLVCVYMNIIENIAASFYRITVPKLIREIILRFLLIGSAMLFFYLQLSIDLYVMLVVFSYALAVVILFSYFMRLQRIMTPPEKKKGIPKELVRMIFPYMGFMMFTGIGSTIVTKVDAFMISSMIGLSGTGIYTISYFMTSVIEIPSKSTMQISAPFVSECLDSNDIPRLKDLYVRYASNQALIGGFLLILLWANINSIFRIMPNGDIYSAGKLVVLFIGLGKLFDLSTGLNNQILIYSKYHRFQLLFVLFLGAITVIGNLLLIPVLGITGAAVASCSSYLLINTVVILFIKRKLGIQPFTLQSVKIFLLIGMAFLVDFLLPTLNSWFFDSLYRSLILVVSFVGIAYFYGFSGDLNPIVMNILRRLGIKRGDK
jgi:O-antigen/teichoic acid export membrane protein